MESFDLKKKIMFGIQGMASKNVSGKGKTWSEYQEWLPKKSHKENMVIKDKHGPNYKEKHVCDIRDCRVGYTVLI